MRILGIGIATLDIINTVDGYPVEDSEVRILHQEKRRGGNSTNTLAVLAQRGHQCSWAGVLGEDPDSRCITADLEKYGIDYQSCHSVAGGRTPTSYITLNQRNGSRTIVHYRQLPEFGFPQFRTIDLSPFDWIHFEGRNIKDTRKMLEYCAAERPALPRSVEVEKARPDIESLFPLANVLLFSRVYAAGCGFNDGAAFLQSVHQRVPRATLVCAWGSLGAFAMDRDGAIITSPAYPPDKIVDTTGAGDVFNAGIIDGLVRSEKLSRTLPNACRLAGFKCGIRGFDGLACLLEREQPVTG